MAVERRRRSEFSRRLVEAGYEDFVVLDHEAARTVLTDRRRGVLDALRDREFESITDLAASLDRDVSAVHRDLDRLYEYSLVDYETANGAKSPRLKHRHVFVEPVV